MGTIPGHARTGQPVGAATARHRRRLSRSVRIATGATLLLGALFDLGSTSRTAVADLYVAPPTAQCAATSELPVSSDAGCFALHGEPGAVTDPLAGLGDSGPAPNSLSLAGKLAAGPGKFAAAIQIEQSPAMLALADDPAFLPPQEDGTAAAPEAARWTVTPALPVLDHAYVDAGTDKAYMRLGAVTASVADTADDQPFGSLGLFDSRAALGAGVQTSQAPNLAGQAIQMVSRVGGGSTLATSLEGLENTPTALASWNYAAGGGSGHLTLLDPDLSEAAGEKLGVLAGGTLNAAPVKLRAAVAADRTGWVNGLVSSQANVGPLTLAASGEYLRNSAVEGEPEQFGGGVTAAARLDSRVSVDGSLNWVHGDAEGGDPEGYQLGIGVTADLARSLKVKTELDLTAGDGATPSTPYGQTQIAWTPAGATAVSAGFARNEDGGYSLTTAAKNSFE